jgi:endonuclease/exonuclease/phosphatase family metal-dependent hydrolase
MPRLRLLTFIIAHGRGLNPIQGLTSAQKLRNNLRKIAKLIERLQPDIVALQEIDECSRWAGNFDHLEYLRLHAGFSHAVFGINTRRTHQSLLRQRAAVAPPDPGDRDRRLRPGERR